MPHPTGVEWAHMSSNPLKVKRRDTGKIGYACVHKGPECLHCYAEAHNGRNLPAGGTGLKYQLPLLEAVEPHLDGREMNRLLNSPKISGKRVFLCSMTDFFGEWWPDEWLIKLLAIINRRRDVQFLVPTKRGDRALKLFQDHGLLPLAPFGFTGSGEIVPPNLRLGFSAGCQESFEEHWRTMRVLVEHGIWIWASCEPLFGPIDLRQAQEATGGAPIAFMLRWLVAGGESGRDARPMDPVWVRNLRDQCQEMGIPFFFKQWGNWVPPIEYGAPIGGRDLADAPRHVFDNGGEVYHVGKKYSGRTLDGIYYNEFPQELIA